MNVKGIPLPSEFTIELRIMSINTIPLAPSKPVEKKKMFKTLVANAVIAIISKSLNEP